MIDRAFLRTGLWVYGARHSVHRTARRLVHVAHMGRRHGPRGFLGGALLAQTIAAQKVAARNYRHGTCRFLTGHALHAIGVAPRIVGRLGRDPSWWRTGLYSTDMRGCTTAGAGLPNARCVQVIASSYGFLLCPPRLP